MKKIFMLLILGGLLAFLVVFSMQTKAGSIPSYVNGKQKEMYLWAKTDDGSKILEQIPCYCGCKHEGHKNAKNCFWKDDGSFDPHSSTCSVCFDIAKTAKAMHEQGKEICEIRKVVDDFYSENRELATDTAMPNQCL